MASAGDLSCLVLLFTMWFAVWSCWVVDAGSCWIGALLAGLLVWFCAGCSPVFLFACYGVVGLIVL